MGIIVTVINCSHQTFSDFSRLQLLLNQVPLVYQDDHQMEVIGSSSVQGRLHILWKNWQEESKTKRQLDNSANIQVQIWRRRIQVAEQKRDFGLLRRIKGYDLFACEAQYHRSCRSNYILDPSRHSQMFMPSSMNTSY